MKTTIKRKADQKRIILILILGIAVSAGYCQKFSSGGYQGGSHGNVTAKTWSGTVDNKWQEAGNWCPAGIPGPDDDVIIPSSATAMPKVDVSGMTCHDIYISAGATVTVDPGFTLSVNGNVTIEKE